MYLILRTRKWLLKLIPWILFKKLFDDFVEAIEAFCNEATKISDIYFDKVTKNCN